MTRSLSVLSKILGLTTSSNPNEARAAEEKLEQQLKARGITREELENSLDMSTVDEEIEAISFRYGKPYKRIDPATATILSAVARFYNGSIVYAFEDREYSNDWSYKSTITRQFEVFCSKKSQIEIEIYTDYILQALDDKWTQHCKEDPFQVAMMGSAHRNNFRKGFAEDIKTRLWKMKREEEENGREIQTESRTINQSALAVQKKNSSEKGIIQAYKKEKYPKLYSSSGTSRGSGSGASAGRSAGSSVGLSRQVAGGGYKALGGY
tara:strand:+ start:3154 stop:3951 length:798 start_codon:yes stop_codon:yes gene_type:complete